MNRVFARSGRLEHRRWLDALKAGRTFATNGPLLAFTLNGREIGDTLSLPQGEHQLMAQVRLTSYVPVDHLEIVSNGEVVATIPVTGDRTSLSTSVPLTARRSGWYLLRARGNGPVYPVLDVHPYATTSPIYVTVGGEPIRSILDADFFLAWIDRLERTAVEHKDWNTESEKETALKSIREARAEFHRRRMR
jgi:hypothetical protein